MKRADPVPAERWTHGGGDLEAAVKQLSASGRLGAYIEFRVEPLGTFVAGDLAVDVRAAWDAMVPRLPAGAIARREGWFSIGAVAAGDPVTLVELARAVMQVLTARPRTPPYRAAALLVEVDRNDPEAALLVDITGHLDDADGDVVGWVTTRRVAPGRPEVEGSVDWIGLSG
jgi:hypothetical protein